MGLSLRPYQQTAVNRIIEHWKTNRSALLVQATGTGKTIVFSEVAKKVVQNNGRVLILAHRDELINQARDKILIAQDLETGIEKASLYAGEEPIVVGSVQTLRNTSRLQRFDPDYFTHIIIDEAHHCVAPQYQAILSYFSNAKILGVTATPYRGDKKDLSQVFDSITYEYTLVEAIEDNYLSPIRFKQIPLKIDLSEVRQTMGDFRAGELDSVLNPYLNEIANIMVEECRNRKTVVFLPLIATSEKFTSILNSKGIRAAEINGKSPDRREILNAFENGQINVLCNSMLLTEGWDCPSVDCIVNLRPTRSEALYTQIIGRGTRKAKNKENLLVLDFLWQSEQYDLCKASVLVAKNKQQEKKINEYFDSGKEIDIVKAREEAERDIVAEREATLAREIAEKRNRKGKLIDPVQYSLSIKAEDLIDYEPQFGWEMAPPSEKQLKVLEDNCIDVKCIPNSGYASKLIDRLITRSKLQFATPKQIRLLERKGFRDVGMWKKQDAGKIIGLIAKNNWRVPYGIDPGTYSPHET